MKLYHGSPKKLEVLKPQQAKGLDEFENLNAIFLTKTKLHAALYAIGKTLKGKTHFGVSENKLVIKGNLEPESGFIYAVEVENPIEGKRGQYASMEKLEVEESEEVYPTNYEKCIVRVEKSEDIIEELKR